MLEARRTQRGVREQELVLVSCVGTFRELASLSPVPQRCMRLDGEPVQRDVVRAKRERSLEILAPLARYTGG